MLEQLSKRDRRIARFTKHLKQLEKATASFGMLSQQ